MNEWWCVMLPRLMGFFWHALNPWTELWQHLDHHGLIDLHVLCDTNRITTSHTNDTILSPHSMFILLEQNKLVCLKLDIELHHQFKVQCISITCSNSVSVLTWDNVSHVLQKTFMQHVLQHNLKNLFPFDTVKCLKVPTDQEKVMSDIDLWFTVVGPGTPGPQVVGSQFVTHGVLLLGSQPLWGVTSLPSQGGLS